MLICPFGGHKSNVKLSKSWMKNFYLGANLSCRSSFCEIWCSFRAYSSCSMHAIVARMGLPFFKVFSNFVHFCPKFQIFCPFFPFFTLFFWKISRIPLLSRTGLVISEMYDSNVKRHLRMILSNTMFQNNCNMYSPRSCKEPKQKILKLSV